MDDFDGKVAVITGGASGIGLATARQLAARGARLMLADIEANALADAATSFEADGTDVATFECDVRHLDQVQALADATFERFGAAHIVFNNAGVAVGGPIVDMTHADWQWIIDVDLWGPIHGVEAFVPRMVEQGAGGHVLFTSSFAGLVPNVGLGPYCVAKYGVVALAEVLRRELRDARIGVSVLCPMRVGTNIGSSERNRQAEYGGAEASPGVEDQADDNPDLAGRVLDVDDVGAAVVAAIEADRLYVLPHDESRRFIRNRFERIDRTFDEQRADALDGADQPEI
jgi:NAD(P)-dependent dehydrogenase (short-subunit alcohol dehydrogenase family)